MFQELSEDVISVLLRGDKNRSIDIPDPHVFATAQELWKMCIWIYEEFETDCSKVRFSKIGIPIHDSEFSTRNISRIVSYAVHICILEGILLRLYLDTIEHINLYLDLKIVKDNRSLSLRKNETEQIRKFRNKVAAHTVYEQPRSDDNTSDEYASLSVLSSYGGWQARDPLSFHLGGLLPIVGDTHPKREKFQIGLYSVHQKMVPHFEAWVEMFNSMLDIVDQSLPITDKTFIINEECSKKYILSASRD